ncbi:Hypothetical protein FKW44_006075, partial [Caligus rogercresseyi]
LFGESKVRTLGSTHLPTSYSPDCSCHEVTSVGQSILGFRDGGAAEFLQHMLRMTRKILRPFHGGNPLHKLTRKEFVFAWTEEI